jgi:hypothetical protein
MEAERRRRDKTKMLVEQQCSSDNKVTDSRVERGACSRWSLVQHGPSGDEVIRIEVAGCLFLKKKGPPAGTKRS